VVNYWAPGEPDCAYCCSDDEQWTSVDCDDYPMRFIGEVHHFLNCVREGTEPAITAADGLSVSQIIEAAYQSSREGKQVALPTNAILK